MPILLWAVFGLIVGLIAKALMGRRPESLVLTSILGIGGAIVGGFIGRSLGVYPQDRPTGGFISSILGAVILIAVYEAIKGVATRRERV